MKTISDAKRLIAANSAEGLRALGAGVSKSCSQQRYNHAAQLALADREAQFTAAERKLVASFIEDESGETREHSLRVRLTDAEHEQLELLADADGIGMSEYVRRKLFGGA